MLAMPWHAWQGCRAATAAAAAACTAAATWLPCAPFKRCRLLPNPPTAADVSSGEEAWLLCFCNSSLHPVFDATEFFFGDTERAAEVVGLLGSFALAPYSLPADLLATNAPLSMTATTTHPTPQPHTHTSRSGLV